MLYLLAILKNETEEDHLGWVEACIKKKSLVDFRIIDFTREDWLEKILSEEFDACLARPPGSVGYYKQLYDERIYVLNQILGKTIYPSYEEIFIYENKKMLSYWLKANKIPHPRTWIFYQKGDAMDFINHCSIPLVAKTAVGGGGSGVRIIKKRQELKQYIDDAFSKKGITRRGGPNLRKGDYLRRFWSRLRNIPKSYRYFKKKYVLSRLDPQRFYVIFQKYIECDFEWRTVRIADSFFAHKKLRTIGDMFSGTSRVSWDKPSEQLLDFVKDITDKRRFLCQAIDIFEPEPGEFLVNEMQTFWGSRNPHQMIVDGKPGRYIQKESQWIFEEGDFNTNNSYDLRLAHVIDILAKTEKIE